MRSLVFEGDTWIRYEKMRRKDKKTHDALRRIIQEILRDPIAGIGKPERLKHQGGQFWSRRIDQKNRVVYGFDGERVYIHAVLGHYERM